MRCTHMLKRTCPLVFTDLRNRWNGKAFSHGSPHVTKYCICFAFLYPQRSYVSTCLTRPSETLSLLHINIGYLHMLISPPHYNRTGCFMVPNTSNASRSRLSVRPQFPPWAAARSLTSFTDKALHRRMQTAIKR